MAIRPRAASNGYKYMLCEAAAFATERQITNDTNQYSVALREST